MKLLTLLGLLLGSLAMLSGCAPAATDAEITQMCENLVKLRGETDTTTAEERTASVNEDFAKRETLHNEQQEAALDGADARLKGKLEEIKEGEGDDDEKQEAKQKLEAEHKAMRKTLEEEGAALLAELKTKKDEALAAAKQKAADAATEHAAAIKQCADEATAEGVNQTVAQCRIKAESTDAYWNQCR